MKCTCDFSILEFFCGEFVGDLWGEEGVVGVKYALAVGLYRGEKNKKNTHYYSKLAFFA